MAENKLVCTADFETDPFLHGREVFPFTAGFYDGTIYKDFWGDDCVVKLFKYLDTREEDLLIYFHNGGRFDFFFMLAYFDTQVKIVNKRILQAFHKHHEFRDSYAIYPESLDSYKKDEIDYKKFERSVREQNKKEIRAYQKNDCIYLYDIVTKFRGEFGDKLTIGSAAMKELAKDHPFDKVENDKFDRELRQYYYGGRTQCFETGIINTNFKVYDINSAYGHVMRSLKHPIGVHRTISRRIGKDTNFAIIDATSYGALPVRTEIGLEFPVGRFEFYATIHEINAGLETCSLKIHRVIEAHDFEQQITFDGFIDRFFAKKVEAEARGDTLMRAFYKRIANSAYGKFAQNPDDYKDYMIWRTGEDMPEEPWAPDFSYGDIVVFAKACETKSYYNVATAASITGATRAILLHGLANAVRPIYCDTDSIICLLLSNVPIDKVQLGAWKLEAEGDRIAIGGKKIYAVFNSKRTEHPKGKKPLDIDPTCIKKACKGSKLTASEIVEVANGKEVIFKNDVPVFSIRPRKDGKQQWFVERKIVRTGKAGYIGKLETNT